ncbi:unnamed protein product [Callosobruchus maculatus]|uniref:Uncharacterized protein n=1 Tax=Callosobruchus maculatus TaxID=64391 RepID=A0A653C574_CALMS|nr:unnamed protein product [Callosobruchus maculatus]
MKRFIRNMISAMWYPCKVFLHAVSHSDQAGGIWLTAQSEFGRVSGGNADVAASASASGRNLRSRAGRTRVVATNYPCTVCIAPGQIGTENRNSWPWFTLDRQHFHPSPPVVIFDTDKDHHSYDEKINPHIENTMNFMFLFVSGVLDMTATENTIRFSVHTLDKATKAKVTLENYYSNLIAQHVERKQSEARRVPER